MLTLHDTYLSTDQVWPGLFGLEYLWKILIGFFMGSCIGILMGIFTENFDGNVEANLYGNFMGI